jgi:hypothetical protein
MMIRECMKVDGRAVGLKMGSDWIHLLGSLRGLGNRTYEIETGLVACLSSLEVNLNFYIWY